MTTELKACPFCGGEAIFDDTHPAYENRMFIGCTECNAEVEPLDSVKYSKSDQIAIWNTRAAPLLEDGYKVKKLERAEGVKTGSFILNHRKGRRKLIVETVGDTFSIQIEEENYGEEPDRNADFYLTPNEALALGGWLLSAAQADFERRIGECIDGTLTNEGTNPVDVAEMRRTALEEAANRFDRISDIINRNLYHQQEKIKDAQFIANEGAATIRALSAAPTEEGEK